jgi:hypothetical protein
MRRCMRRLLVAGAVTAGALIGATGAAAQPAVGVIHGGGNVLAAFDTGSPGTITALQSITGLRPGEQIEAIDFRDRPAPSVSLAAQALYGLAVTSGTTDTGQLYRIDIGTGAATRVGEPITDLPPSTAWDVDFDPATDQLRLVTDSDLNMRIDPDTAAATIARAISPSFAEIGAIAYDEEAPGRIAALLGFEDSSRELVRIDGDDGGIAIYGVTDLPALAPGMRVGYDYTPFDPATPSAQQGFVTVSTVVGTGGLYRVGAQPGVRALEPVGELGASLRAFALLPTTTVQFGADTFATSERDRATITVVRSGPISSTASVAYTTVGGSATAGVDYVPASGVLTFAPGQSSATFELAPLADARTEADETVQLSLSSPSAGLALGPRSAVALTLHDAPPPAATPLTLSGLPQRIGLRRLLRRGVRVTVAAGAPLHALEVSLVARARRAQISRSGALVLADRRLGTLLRSGARTIRLKPRRRLVGQPRHPLRLRVVVTGLDESGQPVSASRALHVAVARRR